MTEKGNPQKGHFGCGLMFNLLTSLIKNNPSNKLKENHTKDDKDNQGVHESFIETIVRAAVIITNIAELSIPVTALAKYLLEIKFKNYATYLFPPQPNTTVRAFINPNLNGLLTIWTQNFSFFLL